MNQNFKHDQTQATISHMSLNTVKLMMFAYGDAI